MFNVPQAARPNVHKAAAPTHLPREASWWQLSTKRNDILSNIPEAAFEKTFCELHFLWHRCLLLNDPQDVQHVLFEHPNRYARSSVLQRLFRRTLGESLITTEGETWRQHRRIMAPAFSPRDIRAHAQCITDATAALTASWNNLQGSPIDLVSSLRQLTITIIYGIMFSARSAEHVKLVQDSVPDYVRSMRPSLFDLLPEWMPRRPIGRPREPVPKLDAVVEHLVTERQSSSSDRKPSDLLDLLLASVQKAQGMDLRQVVDHCAHLVIAGHETTEQTLLWTWYLLSQHRAQETKLHAELDNVLAGKTPGADDLGRLPYTRMVVEETMRLYPAAHTLIRQALVDDRLPSGRYVRKGSHQFIVPFVIHRHRQLWHQPDVFDPERFAANRAGSRHDFAYLPFGGGPRTCIGESLAMMELTLILAHIAQHYRLRLIPGQQIKPSGAVSLRPSKGMMMIVEPR